jgi:hypothetical protein
MEIAPFVIAFFLFWDFSKPTKEKKKPKKEALYTIEVYENKESK